MQFPRTTRTLKLVSSFLFGALLAASSVSAANAVSAGNAVSAADAVSPAAGETPAFIRGSIYSSNAAPVAEVVSTLAADVVIIDGGLKQGLRLGMVCRVTRGLAPIGELIIIESSSDRSAGLILELVEDSTIQAGDIARIKTLQNS
jgi:hypothetical protein